MTPAPSSDDPLAAWTAWRERRAASLRDPEGWLALVGLHWLEPGENHVEGLPGRFVVDGEEVSLRASPADGYHLEGAPVVERVLRSDAKRSGSKRSAKRSDSDARPDRLRIGSRTVGIIQRGPALAVRIWDAASPALQAFRGIDAFPFQPGWRIEARWEAYDRPREVELPAAAGPPQRARAPGRAHFTVGERALALEPTEEPGGALLFVFRDATAPRETYGAGRFLSASPPHGAAVTLDFNRAYNPPCAFTPWATCPLASPENVLPVRVEAGEKAPRDHP